MKPWAAVSYHIGRFYEKAVFRKLEFERKDEHI
jgi:hypothetical protein